jgi:N-acetylmuramoyl-L-alanine amidase
MEIPMTRLLLRSVTTLPRVGALALALGLACALPASGAAVAAKAKEEAPAPLAGMVVAKTAAEVPSRGGATLQPQATGSLDGRVVVVDPGHNGVYRKAVNTKLVPAGGGKKKACNSSGTATDAGFSEHQFNWKVAKLLVGELRSRGATVVLTRPDDNGTGPCVNERAGIGNRAAADLVVSIHADGSYAKGARGFHLIISTTMKGGDEVEATSKAIAKKLRTRIEEQTEMPRSTYIGGGTALSPRSDIAGLNLSKAPGVMLEAGNMRNAKDAALLGSIPFRVALADALADGVEAALS